jgi:hypothetical protein
MITHRLGWFSIFQVRCGLILVVLGANFATLNAKMVGGLNMAADWHFDCDSISATAAPEHRWLSFPGGRLCLNPASKGDFVIAPTPADLALDLGGYAGTEVLRLPKVMSLGLADAPNPASGISWSSSQNTTWYPYKLGLEATYADGATLSGCDFFADKQSTLIRVVEINHAPGKMLCLTGEAEGSSSVSWDKKNQVLLVSGEKYNYALGFTRLVGESWSPRTLAEKPTIDGTAWRLELPLDSDATCYGISFGFSTGKEGGAAAINRVRDAFEQPVKVSLAKAKATFENFLCKVPIPTQWGLQAAPALGVTPEQQRQTYYMAWTFIYQSFMDVLPENPEYPYPQMTLGKGALWAEGERTSPATCGWESLLGVQWLSFIEPDSAWRAYEGIMSRVDEHGKLGGESLPSRKAQTAWILFQQQPDREKLSAVYPAIKRYLLWREQNPRWIYGNNDSPDEKDLEFVVSWLLDIEYAARIADALGKPDDGVWWRNKTQPMIDNLRKWFFNDPKELHQYYFTGRGVYSTTTRNEVRPVMILTALDVSALPPDMAARLAHLFSEIHKPGADNDGFNYLKYPDNDLLADGLIQRGMPAARPYIEAVLRDCIRGGEFAEDLENWDGKGLNAAGVKPSLFNAMNIIEFTWLLNGVRYDSGKAVVCKLPVMAPSLPQK